MYNNKYEELYHYDMKWDPSKLFAKKEPSVPTRPSGLLNNDRMRKINMAKQAANTREQNNMRIRINGPKDRHRVDASSSSGLLNNDRMRKINMAKQAANTREQNDNKTLVRRKRRATKK